MAWNPPASVPLAAAEHAAEPIDAPRHGFAVAARALRIVAAAADPA